MRKSVYFGHTYLCSLYDVRMTRSAVTRRMIREPWSDLCEPGEHEELSCEESLAGRAYGQNEMLQPE